MKKIISALLVMTVLLCAFAGCSAGNKQPAVPDFRNTYWGENQTSVSKSESVEYVFATDSIIFYETELEETGDNVEITYVFENDKLTEAEMFFVYDEEVTIDQAIEKYLAYRDVLKAKYGDPVDDDYRVWLHMDEDTKEDADRLQLYYGRMIYSTVWETAGGLIDLNLSCNGYVVTYKLIGSASVSD